VLIHGSSTEQSYAAEGLGRIGDAAARSALEAAENDPDIEVRVAVRAALASLPERVRLGRPRNRLDGPHD
jgi:HEAT repeat protein